MIVVGYRANADFAEAQIANIGVVMLNLVI